MVTESELEEYVGAYERGIEIKINGESLTTLGYVLAPMGGDKSMVTNGEEQVRFERNKEGRIADFVVMFRDGREVRFGRKDN